MFMLNRSHIIRNEYVVCLWNDWICFGVVKAYVDFAWILLNAWWKYVVCSEIEQISNFNLIFSRIKLFGYNWNYIS